MKKTTGKIVKSLIALLFGGATMTQANNLSIVNVQAGFSSVSFCIR